MVSSGSQKNRGEILGALRRELRQFNGFGASFFRVAAARIGMASDTDMQVMDILDLTGEASAGEIAERMGMTSGAIARMLNRLEEAGFIRRDRDPNDGRKVIVRLERDKDEMDKVRSTLDSLEKMWDEVTSRYDEEQLALFLEFLQHSNVLSQKELVQLQGMPPDVERIFSAPREDVESGQLIISSGVSGLTIQAGEGIAELYRARFEGPLPDVKAKNGVVTIRYPRRLLAMGMKPGMAHIKLNTSIPWRIVIQGGASEAEALLEHLDLAELEVKGGFSLLRLRLPQPSRVVLLRISAAVSEIDIRRPAGVAVRFHLKGWVSRLIFDDQILSNVGKNAQLQSPGFELAAPHYDVEFTSAANQVTITSS